MKKIRIGNDLVIRVTVTRLGEAEDFEGKTLRLTARSPLDSKELAFTVSGNTLTAVWLGTEQTKTGTYTLTLTEDYGDGSRNTVDERAAFALVSHSCQETDGQTGTQTVDCALDCHGSGETTDIDLDVTAPSNGLSAYEIAVKNGYEGTEAEWLESLKGEAQVSMVLIFDGYVEGVNLMDGKADSPSFVAFDEKNGVFVAGVTGTKGVTAYYADFDTYGAFAASDYGTLSAKGRTPVVQRMYCDTEEDTLCWWDGKNMCRMYEGLTDEELDALDWESEE